MSELNARFENDFKEYISYTEKRPHLNQSNLTMDLKNYYELLFIFSNVIYIFRDLDNKSNMWDFICETKNDLIICFDLLNMNYHTASKKILRSSIESFFRFSLSLARYEEYKENREQQIFSATDSLRNLKSMVATHKVGKMTTFTLEYFSETEVANSFVSLNRIYSSLSGNVHVNSKENFTPHRFLSNYLEIKDEDVVDNLKVQKSVLINILIILYYFDLKSKRRIFSKPEILKIENIGGEEVSTIFDKFTNEI